MTTPWGNFLDLSDPNESTYYDDLIQGLPSFPPTLLNHWLTHHVALRSRQEEGVIIAQGLGFILPECHDKTLVMREIIAP